MAHMANNDSLRLLEEHEGEITSWIEKENSSGTVLRRELLRWFVESVLSRDRDRRDGAAEGPGRYNEAAAPDHTDDLLEAFLDRHADIGRKVQAAAAAGPPQPAAPPPRTAGLRRLQEKMQNDRRQALFAGNPPPPRQPAPYPEGECIYRCNKRVVVRHQYGESGACVVTKYTTSTDGMSGWRDEPNEAVALRFVRAHTTIPVPAVVESSWDRVTMEYVEGQTLQQAWPVLTAAQRAGVLAQLRDYIAQLQGLVGAGVGAGDDKKRIGRLDGQGVLVPCTLMRGSSSPFDSLSAFHAWLVRPSKRVQAQSMYWHQITTQLASDCPIVFTHGDLAARNVIVRDGRIVALLDWEFAGWYPAYWEYVFTLRGMDNNDWETLGSHVPSLFSRRYDLEYILVGFILSLS